LEWHLVGPLQSNKTRIVAARFDWVHTVESGKVARRLSDQRPAGMPALNVLIQVNVSGEASKSGVAPAEVLLLAKEITVLPRLKLRGLMAIPEPGANVARYRELKALYKKLKSEFAFDTLSVGMSDDMETAIAEGSTMVRVGTAIFGARNKVRSAA
jgi:pyridoxal phosphate enzyme (YggS family)